MSNSYFQFKQFTVNQEKSAMKVCTDACVFGAYISLKEKDCNSDETNILDIGTGTGLLSLMIAQKVKGNIEAVEIDEKAYEQAQENFKISAWQPRLTVHHADITQFSLRKKYDIIVSNPPFFYKALKSSNYKKNLARHTTSLSHIELSSIVSANLIDNGKFYILLPYEEFKTFEKTASKDNLKLFEKLNIRQYEISNCLRTIGVFSNIANHAATTESLTIKDHNDKYSKNFVQFLKDYYLYL